MSAHHTDPRRWWTDPDDDDDDSEFMRWWQDHPNLRPMTAWKRWQEELATRLDDEATR